ncbi:metallophosphoesterase [Allochromatium tepidum]|nr:metallophosphoesterase [Allochromatium tepidum]
MIQYFEKNHIGRDWVVGDIHGMFSLLESTLNDIEFNPKYDRLFCTGDLIDRGHESIRVLDFLRQPWFFSVRGNHDIMPIRALRALLVNDEIPLLEWKAMGGEWFDDHSLTEVIEVAQALMDLPMLIEIKSANGVIGITHGEPKIGLSWPQIKVHLENGCHLTLLDILLGRHRMEALLGDYEQARELSKTRIDQWSIQGIDHLILGHTVIPHWFRLGNIHYIDTGACHERGCLTLIDISHPGFLHHRGLSHHESLDYSGVFGVGDPSDLAFLNGQNSDVIHATCV